MADDNTSGEVEKNVIDGQVWSDFCDALKQAGEVILREDSTANPLDRAEGWRYLSRLTRLALEQSVEHADTEAPTLFRSARESRRLRCSWCGPLARWPMAEFWSSRTLWRPSITAVAVRRRQTARRARPWRAPRRCEPSRASSRPLSRRAEERWLRYPAIESPARPARRRSL